MKPQLMSLLMGGITLLAVPAGAADETINCTATPDCTSLGYTQSADSCPDGGIKCPFDEDRMFCLRSADLGFRIKNDVKAGDILYTDGTSSATYTKGKGAIGIVLRPHPGNPRHALVILNSVYAGAGLKSNGMTACSNGFGKGIFGTGKYLGGVGEVVELQSIWSKIDDTVGYAGFHISSPSSIVITGTFSKSGDYYYYSNSTFYQGSGSTWGYGYCVIYL